MVAATSFCFVSQHLIVGLPAEDAAEEGRIVNVQGLVARHLEGVTAAIPTLIGRIIQMAGARDPFTGLYRWRELDLLPHQGEVSELVRKEHQRLLWHWLGQSLSYRTADLALWLATDGARDLAGKLLLAGKYDHLLPLRVPESERQHFLMDIEVVVSLVASKLEPAARHTLQEAV